MASQYWEDRFRFWAKPPSETEQTKCDNAVSMIKDAITEDDVLSRMDVEPFAHGSYSANTNVREDSDVDICICLNSSFYFDPFTPDKYSINLGGISFVEYKNTVWNAIVHKFGRVGVAWGNKALDIHENSYRINADVLPAFRYRRYTDRLNIYGEYIYLKGIAFITDGGKRIINWPQQTYDNGVAKNEQTSRRYKGVIRILKRLRNEMQEQKIPSFYNIASSLIESLVWNVANTNFGNEQYVDDVRNVLICTYNGTKSDEPCQEWGEVNELKYLFRPSQPWTREAANAFILAAWRYLEFE